MVLAAEEGLDVAVAENALIVDAWPTNPGRLSEPYWGKSRELNGGVTKGSFASAKIDCMMCRIGVGLERGAPD